MAYPDSQTIQPTQKHSALDLIRAFCGDEELETITLYGQSESFWEAPRMTGTLHRCCAWYWGGKRDQVDATLWRPHAGTGPLGPIGRNLPDAARVYMGQGRFPTNYDNTTPVF